MGVLFFFPVVRIFLFLLKMVLYIALLVGTWYSWKKFNIQKIKSNYYKLVSSLNGSIGSAISTLGTSLGVLGLGNYFEEKECTIEILSADMEKEPNKYDLLSKPDCYVRVKHHNCIRRTQTEGNTYHPKFLFSARMPLKTNKGNGKGFIFVVLEDDVLSEHKIMGRAYISAERAEKLILSGEKTSLSIGDGIGEIEIRITLIEPDYDKGDKKLLKDYDLQEELKPADETHSEKPASKQSPFMKIVKSESGLKQIRNKSMVSIRKQKVI
uniref:C2 domain-containing protein n=1 Tax=Chaetoceros debilis TaxID=122233 RepID=A0A7S3PUY9_9STRA|mmetsp:Transcript_11274/g.16395  ORF Transcript_11274/g.16395 Transcript_11274/m.16395 type:complete len:268 (+) Transcript_11274:325-1128(+)